MLSSLQIWQQMPPRIHTQITDSHCQVERKTGAAHALREMASSLMRNSPARPLNFHDSTEERSASTLANSEPADHKTKQLDPNRSLSAGEQKINPVKVERNPSFRITATKEKGSNKKKNQLNILGLYIARPIGPCENGFC